MKAWPVLGISFIAVFLLLAHWFLFHTWMAFFDPPGANAVLALRGTMLALGLSFVFASLLSLRYSNALVSLTYRFASVWLGVMNYLFWAACLSWLAWYVWAAIRPNASPDTVRPLIAGLLMAVAVITSLYGVINARWIRVRRIAVELPGLPLNWRGRKALLISDVHLGNVNGAPFARRIVAMAQKLQPDIVFVPGDLFDGTAADLDKMAVPFKDLQPPFGIYFSTGNHEEFASKEQYVNAAARAGMRVLNNEKVVAEGLHIAGVPYGDSTSPIRLRAILEGMQLNPNEACILLNHMPSRLPIVERAHVSLQISGHTHGGQFFPFTLPTRRIFGKFTHGLHRFGSLQVYTSTGVGTWGPPMRVGTHPEIVLLEFV